MPKEHHFSDLFGFLLLNNTLIFLDTTNSHSRSRIYHPDWGLFFRVLPCMCRHTAPVLTDFGGFSPVFEFDPIYV